REPLPRIGRLAPGAVPRRAVLLARAGNPRLGGLDRATWGVVPVHERWVAHVEHAGIALPPDQVGRFPHRQRLPRRRDRGTHQRVLAPAPEPAEPAGERAPGVPSVGHTYEYARLAAVVDAPVAPWRPVRQLPRRRVPAAG